MDTTSTRGRGLRAWAVLAAILCIAGGMLAALPSPAAAADVTIYVDTSAIDDRTDLTKTEKDEVKAAIKEEIKRNLETAFGPGKVEVTDKPSDKKKANRTVTIKNDLGTGTDKDGNTTHPRLLPFAFNSDGTRLALVHTRSARDGGVPDGRFRAGAVPACWPGFCLA